MYQQKSVSFSENNEDVVFDATSPSFFISISYRNNIPMKNNVRKHIPLWYKHIVQCSTNIREEYIDENKKMDINNHINNLIEILRRLNDNEMYELKLNCYHKRSSLIFKKEHIKWLESIKVY